MMKRKLSFLEIAATLLNNLRKNTQYNCYDAVPDNTPSPLIFAEVVGKRDSSSKTMYKETFIAYVHAIAAPGDSRVQIYNMIHDVEEALTEDLVLPDDITFLFCTETGVQSVQSSSSFEKDETNERHKSRSYKRCIYKKYIRKYA